MAWRNIGRNRRRTAVTVAAITLALFVSVVYTGMLQGLLADMEHSVTEVEIGDVQIHTADYLNNPSLYERIEEVDPLIEALEEAGFRASPRLVGASLVAARESSAGAQLRGVDVMLDARVSQISQRVTEGEWLDPADPHGVVIGYRLARALALEVGDELVALSQAADGSMANDLFSVRGILSIVGDSVDRSGVFLTEAMFREFFVISEGAHEIVVRRPAGVDLAVAAETVRGLAPGLDAKSWRELLPTLATYFDTASQAMWFVAAIIYLVIAILILNAMLMAVFERIREFGLLKALGVEPGQVMSLILVESGAADRPCYRGRVGTRGTHPVVSRADGNRYGRAHRDVDHRDDAGVHVVRDGDANHRGRPGADARGPRAAGGALSGAEGGAHQPGRGDAVSVTDRRRSS